MLSGDVNALQNVSIPATDDEHWDNELTVANIKKTKMIRNSQKTIK